jgi:hypothetical protein
MGLDVGYVFHAASDTFHIGRSCSLEVECNDHFESDPPRPLSILCCEDCGEIHIREAGVKKGGSVEGDGQRITEDS